MMSRCNRLYSSARVLHSFLWPKLGNSLIKLLLASLALMIIWCSLFWTTFCQRGSRVHFSHLSGTNMDSTTAIEQCSRNMARTSEAQNYGTSQYLSPRSVDKTWRGSRWNHARSGCSWREPPKSPKKVCQAGDEVLGITRTTCKWHDNYPSTSKMSAIGFCEAPLCCDLHYMWL